MNTSQIKFLALGLILAVASALPSCSKDDIADKAEASAALQVNSYGSCPTCQLPTSISGPLSTLLSPTGDFVTTLKDCYEEELSELGNNCMLTVNGGTPISNQTNVYIQYAQLTTNSFAEHCSHLYQLGVAAQGLRPANDYYLHSIDNVQHLWGSNFRITCTWKRYICQASVPKR